MSVFERILTELNPSTNEERALFERVLLLHLWGFSVREIHSTLTKEGYELTHKQAEALVSAIRQTVENLDLGELSADEIKHYVLRTAQMESELNELFLLMKNSFLAQLSGQFYDESGNRLMPVSPKDLVAITQAIEKMARARVSALHELVKAKHAQVRNALPANTSGPSLDEFIRKPEEEIIDVEVSN